MLSSTGQPNAGPPVLVPDHVSAEANRLPDHETLKPCIWLGERDRIVGTFEAGDQQTIRTRLAASFRYFISQRLVPLKAGGRIAVLEVLKATMRTREYIERGEAEGKSLLDAMRDGEMDGMQHFDGEIEKLITSGAISLSTGLLYASNPGNLQVQLVGVALDEDEPAV